MNAGFKDPANTNAKYSDKDALLENVPALAELFKITNAEFMEDPKNKNPAETVDKNIYLNMSKINNLLFFAYTLGHEMNHVFDNRFFKDKFIEMTPFGRADSIPFRNTFGLFKESTGLGWEMQMGNSALCGFSGFEAASYYYGPNGVKFYYQETIDKLKPYMNELLRARTIIYNTKKNNLK